ncbi:hypothetical protein RclHR1_02340011 [Rhizophagus clarus]|uniref:DNA-directed DNA polymerase n=1 Tax=Rhizophagus clarus TaxID=94130 RepID=A0A2Z6R994_9GLOM|nr:hypothetical protein RclHR1_02340011 [Rhizophagus clarus]
MKFSKRRLAPLSDRKEELEKEISLAEVRGEDVTDALKSEYSSVSFIVACLDTKQFTLKAYINTFYGEAENSRTSFFLRVLAGGVTSASQRNIKLIADLVRSKRFSVKYRNTDSLYLVCLKEYFQKCDEAYDSGNGISIEEYWSRMVNISMEVIERLCDEVNDFFRNDNGSSYLKIAYERVLFLVVFTGKKKYYGILHRRQPNFNNKLFIQGIKIVKREQSKHFREPSSKIVLRALNKLKDSNKADDNEADDDGMDKDDLDENEEDEDEMDEDEVSKIRDALAQKSAEKWIRSIYAKSLFDNIYANKIVKCLGNDAYWSSFLSALDEQEESIHIKLTTLLAEISQDDIGCKEKMYKLVTKSSKRKLKAMTLERYMLIYIQENGCALLANL